jgi:hypothetical protein
VCHINGNNEKQWGRVNVVKNFMISLLEQTNERTTGINPLILVNKLKFKLLNVFSRLAAAAAQGFIVIKENESDNFMDYCDYFLKRISSFNFRT